MQHEICGLRKEQESSRLERPKVLRIWLFNATEEPVARFQSA